MKSPTMANCVVNHRELCYRETHLGKEEPGKQGPRKCGQLQPRRITVRTAGNRRTPPGQVLLPSSQTSELLAIPDLSLGCEYCPGPQATQQLIPVAVQSCALFAQRSQTFSKTQQLRLRARKRMLPSSF